MHRRLYAKCLLFFSDFNRIWTSSTDLRKEFKYKMSQKKIRPVGAEVFHADRHPGRQTRKQKDRQT